MSWKLQVHLLLPPHPPTSPRSPGYTEACQSLPPIFQSELPQPNPLVIYIQDLIRFPVLFSFMAVVKACSSAFQASTACCCRPLPPPSLTHTHKQSHTHTHTHTPDMSVKRTRTETGGPPPPVSDSHVGQVGVRAANEHAASGFAAPVFSLQLNLRGRIRVCRRFEVLGFCVPVNQLRTETGGPTFGPVFRFRFYPIHLMF